MSFGEGRPGWSRREQCQPPQPWSSAGQADGRLQKEKRKQQDAGPGKLPDAERDIDRQQGKRDEHQPGGQRLIEGKPRVDRFPRGQVLEDRAKPGLVVHVCGLPGTNHGAHPVADGEVGGTSGQLGLADGQDNPADRQSEHHRSHDPIRPAGHDRTLKMVAGPFSWTSIKCGSAASDARSVGLVVRT